MKGRKKNRQTRRGASRPQPRRPFPLRGLGQGVLWLSLLGMIAWGIVYLADPQTLPMRKVSVDGQFTHITKQRLHEAVAACVTGGFFSVDLEAIQLATERLPWVAEASVHRIWPDSLRIQIKEQVALARWGKDALVSVKGKVFVPPKESFPKGLPELNGPSGSGRLLATRLKRVRAQLKSLNLRVTQLTMGERRDWHVVFENGIELVLGRGHSTERLTRFRQVYARLLQFYREDIKRIDMRYTNGFAVTWRGGVAPGSIHGVALNV